MTKPATVPPNLLAFEAAPRPYVLAIGTPALLPLISGQQIFQWYQANLCGRYFTDPRRQRVSFLDTDFVHLVKLVSKYGEEPRNRGMTIGQIKSGRLKLVHGRFDSRRAEELTWARSIIESPDMIVPNWQIMGRANPGDAYIKNLRRKGDVQSFAS
jgi:hypothetical protein